MKASLLAVIFVLARLVLCDDDDSSPDSEDSPLTFYPPPPANSGPVTVRIFNKANPELFLTGLWNGKVVMMLGNGTTSYQQWILDTTWGDKFTDAVGYKAFMLVNRASGMILRHGYSENSMVTSTTKAKADLLETLWSRGPDLQGFHTIRACSKVELIMDVDHGDKRHLMVPVKEGFKVVMFKMSLEETQYWRMEPLT